MPLSNIKRLDGVRALAIFLILIWHYSNKEYLLFWTWSGVDLFFVLSGFLIGRILIFHRSSPAYFKTFYLRRIFRIFPAYYLVLLIFLIFLLSGIGTRFPWLAESFFPPWSYFLYLQNFWMAYFNDDGTQWLSVTWSLAIEEQFYLILPLLIFLIKPKWLPALLVLLIIMAPVCRSVLPGLGAYVLLPARMDALLTGVLIAYYYLNGTIEKFFLNKQKVLILVIAIFFVSLFFIEKVESIGGTFMHSVLALLYGVFLILVLISDKASFLVRSLSTPVMAFMAKISYMVYLTHQLFSLLAHKIILHQNPQVHTITDAGVTLAALVVTIGFAALSYKYVEKPILNLGKKYTY